MVQGFTRLFSALDHRTRAIFAGLGVGELRALLRGEPPTEKPNPRLRAHVTSFVLHIRPRTYRAASTWFTHTFRLGFFTTLFFFIELFTGIILMLYYVPSPESAYGSILRLDGEVPFGNWLRDVHRLAGELMVITAVLHMARVFLTASYRQTRAFTWLTGVILLLLTLLLAFSGYLLPWDQLAYWAVTIGTSMAAAAPFLGETLVTLLRGGAEIGADGLLRFYLLHIILLPFVALVILGVHYYRVARIHSISLPAHIAESANAQEKERAVRPIPLLPTLLRHELFLISVSALVLTAVVVWFYDAPLQAHADPQRTPFGTEAPWFFLWLQGLLKFGDKTWLGFWLPLLVVLVLFFLPYLDRNPSRLARKRPFALAGGVVFAAALIGLSYAGTANFGITQPPAQHIAQSFASDHNGGFVRQVPYEQLAIGIYEIDENNTQTLPPGMDVLVAQLMQLAREARTRDGIADLQTVLAIEEIQNNVKRVTLRLSWTDTAQQQVQHLERVVYISRAASH